MSKMTQAQFIKQFNDKTREKFNESLFNRSDEDTVHEIEKVVRSCVRNNKYYSIDVHDFYTVTDYSEIYERLKRHEISRVKSKSNRQKIKSDIEERYASIQLKDSDIFLIVIIYRIRINTIDEKTGKYPEEFLEVLIEVPRIVDKYYFHIYGSHYLAVYQIVDGSTYNNTASTSKHPNVTLKTMFMATRIYRYKDTIKTTKGVELENVDITYYDSRIFGKPVPIMKYLLARFGLIEAFERLKTKTVLITDYDLKDPEYYTFKKHNVYVSAPKYVYANDIATQSMVYTLLNSVEKTDKADDLSRRDYWLTSLGANFNSATSEKGSEILESLQCIYDLSTKESLRLPEKDKEDIYGVLIWIIREFPNLRGKDNMDLSTKRIRLAEYLAALYAMKVAKSIYRTGNYGKNVELTDIEKAIYTQPEFLLKKIMKDNLVNYRNSVNDLDSIAALKFTYKGVSGLGDGSSVPSTYRKVDKSYLGRLDLDASSHSDPGMSGTICPLSKIQNSSFSDYQEPNNWRDEVEELMKNYMEIKGLQQLISFQEEMGLPVDDVRKEHVNSTVENMTKLFKPITFFDND